MDKNIAPEISVVMPVYNGALYVSSAIESILAQTYRNFEFIIIDNASTDNTTHIIASYKDGRITIIKNQVNIGLIASLNIGLKAARGKYIARMDHDDISFPERFQKEYDFLESHPEIVLVGTWSEMMNSQGERMKQHRNATRNSVIKYELMFGNTITHPSIMFRRKEIVELGGYDPKWVNTEDYNLYSRAIRKYKLSNIPESLLYYRVHGASLTGAADSQAIIHENTKKMIRENISYYVPISDLDHELVTSVITARIPNPEQSWKKLYRAYKLHKKIYKTFLKKECSTLDRNDRYEIRMRYLGRRNLMFTKYLVGKYHLLTRKNA